MASSLKPKRVSDSQTVMSQLMMPQEANHFGYVHGGSILSIADKVAYVCGSRHAEEMCTTAAVDSVEFRLPIKVGHLVTFLASVNYVGRTSMEVGMKIFSEDLLTGEKKHTNSCYFTIVAVNEKGKPIEVPPLLLETDQEKERSLRAKARREFRLKQRQKGGELK